jgi:predicted acylesterase/phospholipase RssA
VISGSSVGAIFAALICSRTDEELAKIGTRDFLELDFPSVRGSLRRKLNRFLNEGILMDIGSLIHCVRSHIGDITFEQAYHRYGRICNITIVPIHGGRKKGKGGVDDALAEREEEHQHSGEPLVTLMHMRAL